MKLNVVLDLDNTLINTVDFNPLLKTKYFCKIYDRNNLICARPYLFEFLEWLFVKNGRFFAFKILHKCITIC